MTREKSREKLGETVCRTLVEAGLETPQTYVTVGVRCYLTPEKMPPACWTAEPPTAEFMCVAASQLAVLIPACMACVTAESAARLFMEDGLVLVVANCVFSSGNSWAAPFCMR